MNIMELLNYRYENPESNVNVDTKITEKFLSKDRNSDTLENFELWASISKEKKEIEKMLSSYRILNEEKSMINITR